MEVRKLVSVIVDVAADAILFCWAEGNVWDFDSVEFFENEVGDLESVLVNQVSVDWGNDTWVEIELCRDSDDNAS